MNRITLQELFPQQWTAEVGPSQRNNPPVWSIYFIYLLWGQLNPSQTKACTIVLNTDRDSAPRSYVWQVFPSPCRCWMLRGSIVWPRDRQIDHPHVGNLTIYFSFFSILIFIPAVFHFGSFFLFINFQFLPQTLLDSGHLHVHFMLSSYRMMIFSTASIYYNRHSKLFDP